MADADAQAHESAVDPACVWTAYVGRSGEFCRWYCETGHAHRTRAAAAVCNQRFARHLAKEGNR